MFERLENSTKMKWQAEILFTGIMSKSEKAQNKGYVPRHYYVNIKSVSINQRNALEVNVNFVDAQVIS